MIELDIPGNGSFVLEHIVFDVNGTLAVDGNLLPGVTETIAALRELLEIHLLTADTHGKQIQIDRELGLEAVRVHPGGEASQKAHYIEQLGAENTAAIGQGANDALMLEKASLGICVLSLEGTALETLLKADLIFPDILSALEALLNPTRLKASLRS
jgi:P-type E1-E2 ATPase